MDSSSSLGSLEDCSMNRLSVMCRRVVLDEYPRRCLFVLPRVRVKLLVLHSTMREKYCLCMGLD